MQYVLCVGNDTSTLHLQLSSVDHRPNPTTTLDRTGQTGWPWRLAPRPDSHAPICLRSLSTCASPGMLSFLLSPPSLCEESDTDLRVGSEVWGQTLSGGRYAHTVRPEKCCHFSYERQHQDELVEFDIFRHEST